MSEIVLTMAEARKLADDIKGGLQNLEKNLKYFHAVQGWLPLGYDSFTMWWDNEMGDLPIARGLKNWALFAMIQENTVGDRIRSGMTPVIAHAAGVSVGAVTSMKTRARPRTRHLSRKDDEPAALTAVVPARWHRHFIKLSVEKDKSMSDLIRPLLKDGMMRVYGIDLDKPLYEE